MDHVVRVTLTREEFAKLGRIAEFNAFSPEKVLKALLRAADEPDWYEEQQKVRASLRVIRGGK